MTREEQLDWLCRLRSEVKIYMPIEWVDHFEDALTESINELSQEPCNLLIIKSHILLHQDARKKWMESIKREKESGVIILPPYFEPLLVPDNIEISIEQETCGDVISREDTLKAIIENLGIRSKEYLLEAEKAVYKTVENMPPVTPKQKIGHCKDCKWWKDSDGVFRRGVRAESQCPINRKEVYEGKGYCYLFEPKESEG